MRSIGRRPAAWTPGGLLGLGLRWAAAAPRGTPARVSLALMALLATIIVATSVGTVDIPVDRTARIILGHLSLPIAAPARGSPEDVIIWEVRIPRVLTAAVVGAALAISGASYQAVFRNHLADPFLLGVAAGAGLGATVAFVLGLPFDLYGFGWVAVLAFAGAMLAVALTYELARVGRTVPTTNHILAGVSISVAASAATSFLLMLNQERAFVIFAWIYGDFTTATWQRLGLVAPYVGVSAVILFAAARPLNVLQLGDDEARTLGVPVERVKLLTIVVASLATAVAVAVSGLIGFVGLIVPHICRLLFGADHRLLLPLSMVCGAIMLVLADLGARTLLAPQEIPVGILTAALGAPFFLVLLRRRAGGAVL